MCLHYLHWAIDSLSGISLKNDQYKSTLQIPPGSCFVSKFCFLPAILSAEIFLNL